MKGFFTILFLTIAICSFAQTKKFKNLEDYGSWMMNYYKNPEPHILFDAFKYGAHNKKIEKDGNQIMIISFFSSVLRKDTTAQLAFYKKIGNTKDEDFIYIFGISLWQIHTTFSLKLLDTFLNQSNTIKYQSGFNKIRAEGFLDIWTDPIRHPEHLDMLWADFFATGNEESVKKIISKLSDLNSNNQFDQVTAVSAKWSLISNSIQHQRVLEICMAVRESYDNKIEEALDKIIEEAKMGRKN
ncbi:MAG: hypothetical protein NVV82_26755 [Sporocytophaga sp.]|nr:hypothetical protein [Sporocytophaga sp.]